MKTIDLYSFNDEYADPITKYKMQLENATSDNYFMNPDKPEYSGIMDQVSTSYTDPKILHLNYDENSAFELGLGVRDNTDMSDKIKDVMDYTHKTFEQTKTTEFMNENQQRLWFWNNVGFLFSEGLILEAEYRVVFNEILEYFNKANQTFLPNVYKILNYNDPTIKVIEQNYNIANGNYHFLLIPFVMTDNPELLKIAPEQAYKRYGPIDVFTDINQIVQYMAEVMYKYGTMKNLLTDAIANKLNLGEQIEDDRYFKHAQRVMNVSSSHPQMHEPMRMNRKGYFDPNTTDNFDLINPQEDILKYAPQRQYFTPGELQWSKVTDSEKSSESNYYRKPIKSIPRTNLTNVGNEYGQGVKRTEGKMTLWNQLHTKSPVVSAGFVDTSMKGGMLKVNTMYESETKRKDEEDKYQIYGDTDRLTSHAELGSETGISTSTLDPIYKAGSSLMSGNPSKIIKGKLIKDSDEQVYIDTVADRENIPIWHQTEINKALESENVSKTIKMPAECRGIFAQNYRSISLK